MNAKTKPQGKPPKPDIFTFMEVITAHRRSLAHFAERIEKVVSQIEAVEKSMSSRLELYIRRIDQEAQHMDNASRKFQNCIAAELTPAAQHLEEAGRKFEIRIEQNLKPAEAMFRYQTNAVKDLFNTRFDQQFGMLSRVDALVAELAIQDAKSRERAFPAKAAPSRKRKPRK